MTTIYLREVYIGGQKRSIFWADCELSQAYDQSKQTAELEVLTQLSRTIIEYSYKYHVYIIGKTNMTLANHFI